MTFQTTVNGQKLSANTIDGIMREVASLLRGVDCRVCFGKGSYLVQNYDDQDWEHCQH